ncbi:hypothetical protein SOJ79_003995 [Cronobacter sakazakii]|nr:hypothetical protein [Cronobacter sakazakii]
MLKSIINGGATTPTMLAKEIVFCHGEHAVVALRSILGTAVFLPLNVSMRC